MLSALKRAFALKANFFSIFERPSDNLAALDGLRALSILWILFFHVYLLTTLTFSPETARNLLEATPWYFNWIWNGDKGVEIFFVMSGFLISGLLFREFQQTGSVDLRSFYLRRFIRLTPVYWFSLLVYVLVGGPNAGMAWANVIYANNFVPASDMAMTWTWTLAVEEQFYLLFPLFLLLVFFRSEHKLKWLAGLLVLACVLRLVFFASNQELFHSNLRDIFNLERSDLFNQYFDTLYINLYTRFGPFICGIAASYLYYFQRSQLSHFFTQAGASVVVVAGAVLTLSMAFAPSFHQDIEYPRYYGILYVVFNRVLFSVGLTMVLLAALFPVTLPGRIFNKLLSLGVWVPIARLSYSIYIVHIFFVTGVLLSIKAHLKSEGIPIDQVNFNWLLASVPLCLFSSGLLAIVMYMLIEKPFMNLRRGFRPRLATDSPADTPAPNPRPLPVSTG